MSWKDFFRKKPKNTIIEKTVCPVCNAGCSLLPAVDFNKSCAGDVLDKSGVAVTYAVCNSCTFCFAPDICTWELQQFEQKIYNDQYILVDPEYVEIRPKSNAAFLKSMFGELDRSVRHLDYGGGNGTLSTILRESNWQSRSYDPFVHKDLLIEDLGKFDFITAFEVFEHVPDVSVLMATLKTLLAPGGVILFSTLLTDGNIQASKPLTWWYASPRNGHISLFSNRSLAILAQRYGFGFGSFSAGTHVFCTEIPPWASRVFNPA